MTQWSLLDTGARYGEIANLARSHIDTRSIRLLAAEGAKREHHPYDRSRVFG